MKTNCPALSGIESAVFGIIALAALAGILLAGIPFVDAGSQASPAAGSYLSSNGAPVPDIASTAKPGRHS